MFSATWHSYRFGSRCLVTTWSQILQLLQTGSEIWAQPWSCPESWVHTICCWWCWTKLKFTGYPDTFHGMGDISNILPGMPTLGEILCQTVKMDELQVVSHIKIRSFVTFSVGLDSQRHEILRFKTALNLQHQHQWKLSFPRHSWSLKMPAVHRDSHSGQCAAYLMPW